MCIGSVVGLRLGVLSRGWVGSGRMMFCKSRPVNIAPRECLSVHPCTLTLCLNFKQNFPNNLIAIILYEFTQGLDSLNSEMNFVNYVSCQLMSASFYLFINNKVSFICILLSRFISNQLIFITLTMNINIPAFYVFETFL